MATLLTTGGKEFLTDITDGTVAVPSNYFVAWGTAAGTTATADSTLFGEVDARVTAAKSQPTTTTNRFVATITAATAKTITNAGLWTQVTAAQGTLMVKGDFTGIALGIGEAIQFTIDVVNA